MSDDRVLAFAKALFANVPLCTGCDFDHGWDDHVLSIWSSTEPLPATPAETGLREAAGRVQDNAVIPDEYEGYYLVRREDYDALVLALRTALSKEDREPAVSHEAPPSAEQANSGGGPTPAETGLREAAQAFVDHVAEAAEWPTPGIGCDAKCLQAGDLRTALSKEERP